MAKKLFSKKVEEPVVEEVEEVKLPEEYYILHKEVEKLKERMSRAYRHLGIKEK